MNKKLKAKIKTAFNTQASKGKQEFLQSFNYPKLTLFAFVLAQIKYIRPRVWIISASLLVSAVACLFFANAQNKLVWAIASALPFIGLVFTTEIVRSRQFAMSELEISCRFNLSQLTLARMIIIGVSSVALLAITQLLSYQKTELNYLRFSFYFFMPFLVSTFGSLFAINRLKTADISNIMASICCVTSAVGFLVLTDFRSIAQSTPNIYLSIMFAGIIFAIGKEIYKFIKQTEEYKWNLSLIV